MQDVIIVDDHTPSRFLLLNQLLSLKYYPVEAGSGKEALELIAERHFDIIFTDLNMPNMSGFELTSKIRSLENESRRAPCKIFGYTSTFNTEVQQLAKIAGMDKCYTKPLTVNELKSCMAPAHCQLTQYMDSDSSFDFNAIVKLFNGNKVVALALCKELYRSNEVDLKLLISARLVGNIYCINHLIHRFAGGARMVGANKLLLVIADFMKRQKHEDGPQFELLINTICELQDSLGALLDSNPDKQGSAHD